MSKTSKVSLSLLLALYVFLTVWGAWMPDADLYAEVTQFVLLPIMGAFLLAVVAVNEKANALFLWAVHLLFSYLIPKAVFGTVDWVWVLILGGIVPLVGLLVGLLFSNKQDKPRVDYTLFTVMQTLLSTILFGALQYLMLLVVTLATALGDESILSPKVLLMLFGLLVLFFGASCLTRLATFLPYKKKLSLKPIHFFLPVLIVTGINLAINVALVLLNA